MEYKGDSHKIHTTKIVFIQSNSIYISAAHETIIRQAIQRTKIYAIQVYSSNIITDT